MGKVSTPARAAALTAAEARVALIKARAIPADQTRGRLSAEHWAQAETITGRRR